MTFKENSNRTANKVICVFSNFKLNLIFQQKQNIEAAANNSDQSGIKQRAINEDDMCPICQDDFLVKKLPVTYCK